MVEWFRRSDVKIKTVDKKEIAAGLWVKCPRCNQVTYQRELEKNKHVCNACNHHFRMSSKNYFKLLIVEMIYVLNFLQFLQIQVLFMVMFKDKQYIMMN